jgi:hypothetical protein
VSAKVDEQAQCSCCGWTGSAAHPARTAKKLGSKKAAASKPAPSKPAAAAKPPLSVATEQVESGYSVSGKDELRCPDCNKTLPAGSILCSRCGYDLEKGARPVKVFDKVERFWETGWPLAKRRLIFLVIQGVFLPLGLIGAIAASDIGTFIISYVFFTALLAFILGTFERYDLSRNKRGQVRLLKTWRFLFLARPPEAIPLREYEGLQTGMADDTSLIDWILLVGCFLSGVIPGLLFWMFVIHPNTFYVALTKNHGFPELYLLRSTDENKLREFATTLHEVADLPLSGV